LSSGFIGEDNQWSQSAPKFQGGEREREAKAIDLGRKM